MNNPREISDVSSDLIYSLAFGYQGGEELLVVGLGAEALKSGSGLVLSRARVQPDI